MCDRCLTYELSRPQEYLTWPADQLTLLVDACTERIAHYSKAREKILSLRTWQEWAPSFAAKRRGEIPDPPGGWDERVVTGERPGRRR